MDLGLGVIQEFHQDGHAVQLADLLLDQVILVTQVLQVGGSVGLDGVHRVPEHGNHLMQVGVSPTGVSSDAVQAHHAAAFVRDLQGLSSAHGLKERIQVSLQLGHESVIVATSGERHKLLYVKKKDKNVAYL